MASRTRSRRRRPQRTSQKRPLKTRILIVGEGQETEPNYFRSLRAEEGVKRRFAVTVKKGPGFSPEIIVDEAIGHKSKASQRGEDFDEVWCVLDVEGVEKRESLKKAMATASANGVNLSLSNPCFEVWFLLHFVKGTRAYLDANAVIAELNKHWSQVCKGDYDKATDDIYNRLLSRLPEAIKNARWALQQHSSNDKAREECNSSTEVHSLVEKLKGAEGDSVLEKPEGDAPKE